jgi:hypothetical protein
MGGRRFCLSELIGTTLKSTYSMHDGHGDLVQLGELESLDEGAGKAINLYRSVGQRPVAAFGNSDGDYEMLQFTTTGQGPHLGVLIHHDDGAANMPMIVTPILENWIAA